MKITLRLSLAILLVVFISVSTVHGQTEIPLVNPSFEGEPRRSVAFTQSFFLVNGWIDWVPFPEQTGPDVHGINTEFWNVLTVPFDGETFVGLVTRENAMGMHRSKTEHAFT